MVVASGIITPRQIGVASLRTGPFYTVASVELGNTTTKCILVSTNLKTAEIFEIEKEVRMTRDVRPPKDNEQVFGTTISGVPFTSESVCEFVSDVLKTTLSRARVDLERDLHFVVRSTGVTAGFAHPSEVGIMVKALAEGCLRAGVPPRKMTASISLDNLPPGLRNFSWLKKVYFDGAVASSLPPASTDIVANEMEGELVTAGLKGAARSTSVDFRNPVLTLDFGTTLAGRITNNEYPYARTIGSFTGLAGAIPDAVARGSSLEQDPTVCTLDILPKRQNPVEPDPDFVEEIHRLIEVRRITSGKRFGTVPVNPAAAADANVVLIGVDVGTNGSRLDELEEIGRRITNEGNVDFLLSIIDYVQARLVQRLVGLAREENLLLPETSLGFTGRAILTGRKPQMIRELLSKESPERELLFVHDGLAMGAAVAARCMNSLGTPRHPMGGRKGDACIMNARSDLQRRPSK
ncbi:MAG: methanogenesis marker 14 protein [Candidatus Thorarchaeota archaeon]|nr:methanogenesis marker 14 protein [Candidatus Thorarchaeota archaeon]